MGSKNKTPGSLGKNNNGVDYGVINLIGSGTTITGDIISGGDIRIDGNMNGNLTTKGKVVIGETGILKGEMNCRNSDIHGRVEGKLVISELLTLKSTAKIRGDIHTNKLAIEPDAMFTGSCNMSDTPIPDEKPAQKEKQQEPKQEYEEAVK